MTRTYNPPSHNNNYGKSYELKIDVEKKFDTEVKTKVNAEYEVKVDVYKDVDVYVDIKTKLDLDGNTAISTGKIENDALDKYLAIGDISFKTTDGSSEVYSNGLAGILGTSGSISPVADVTVYGSAWGHKTYAELDFQMDVTKYSVVTTWTGESATD